MQTKAVPTSTYGNIEKDIVKIAIFAEMDQAGEVFYKIEGQAGMNCTAIAFIYDIEKAVEHMTNIVNDLLAKQTIELKLNKN